MITYNLLPSSLFLLFELPYYTAIIFRACYNVLAKITDVTAKNLVLVTFE